MQDIETLKDWITNSHNIVFFGGAGVSTESGIPDFRSVDGLYNLDYDYPPETILSHTFFYNQSEEFFRFYKAKMLYLDAQPSFAHTYLAELEKQGKLQAIITQNIDGLHQKAGSKNVIELHGSVLRNNCNLCHKAYSAQAILDSKHIPYCECGGIIKPDVVLYEEALNRKAIDQAITLIQNAEVLIIGGTSLNVYPAASFIDYYRNDKLVLINLSPTPKDHMADLVLHQKLGDVFKQL